MAKNGEDRSFYVRIPSLQSSEHLEANIQALANIEANFIFLLDDSTRSLALENERHQNKTVLETTLKLHSMGPGIQWNQALANLAQTKKQTPHVALIADLSALTGQDRLLAPRLQALAEIGVNQVCLAFDCWSQGPGPTLPGLCDALKKLETARHHAADPLKELRAHIDQLDREIMESLALRFWITRHVAESKQRLNLPALQKNRMEELLKARASAADELGLSADFVHQFFQLIHDESVKTQSDLMDKGPTADQNKEGKNAVNPAKK